VLYLFLSLLILYFLLFQIIFDKKLKEIERASFY